MLIQGGLVMKERHGAWVAEPLDLRVEENVITACAAELPSLPGEDTVSAAGLLVLPGFVNAHVHSYTNLLKGTSFGEPLELWGLGTVALGGALSPEDMSLSAQLGVAEMLRYGVTACIDHIPHPTAVDSIAGVYRDVGFRAVLAPMLHDRSDHLVLTGIDREIPPAALAELRTATGLPTAERLAQYRQWVRNYHRPAETVSMMVGINAPQRCTEKLLQGAGELAREHEMGVQMHLLETLWQRDSGIAEGRDPLEKIADAGLLHDRTSLAHCVHLTAEQLDRVAAAGASVVHNPTSNLFLGSGVLPLGEFRKRGVPVAFGSDGCNCATNHNLLEVARTALLLERSREPDPAQWRPLADWYNGLTRFGWSAMGHPYPGGALEIGAPADIIFCGMNRAALLPLSDSPMQFLVNQSAPDVVHSMIAGKFVMRDRKILAFDEELLLKTLLAKSAHLRRKFEALLTAEPFRPAYERAFRHRMEEMEPSR